MVVGPGMPTTAHGRFLGFWSNSLLLCDRHNRGMLLQPFTGADRTAGFGARGCPFCPGGELEGTYHRYPSQRKLAAAMNALAQTPAPVSPVSPAPSETPSEDCSK